MDIKICFGKKVRRSSHAHFERKSSNYDIHALCRSNTGFGDVCGQLRCTRTSSHSPYGRVCECVFVRAMIGLVLNNNQLRAGAREAGLVPDQNDERSDFARNQNNK